MTSGPNVPSDSPASKADRVPRSISFPSEADLRVVDTAASMVGKDRSAYVIEKVLPAAESDLRSAGIDPDAIRRAA